MWGKKGKGPGEFDKPTGLAVGPHDLIYIGEVYNNRVQVFDKQGTFITMFGKGGSGNSEFGNVHGLIVDDRGYVYVADSANNRIQVFKPVVR